MTRSVRLVLLGLAVSSVLVRAATATPDPDPTGACCLDPGECVQFTIDQCDSAGGAWQGVFSECEPNPCPQPPGGCCLPSGECVLLGESECLQAEGEFAGAGVECSPTFCAPPLPTDPATWGEIKRRYR
ncbi:MAG: hypothetical protein IT349_00975 [Candidatus Eisenbacteria bacterium]|nr:hypothetical protein [Candidatus Eisenbacteria bacterium]